MGNMSYCRFENTYHDLRDCEENIHDTDLSDSEKECRELLIEVCRRIVEESELMPEDEEVDETDEDSCNENLYNRETDAANHL